MTCTECQTIRVNQLVSSRSIYFKMTLTGFSTSLQVRVVAVHVWFLNFSKVHQRNSIVAVRFARSALKASKHKITCYPVLRYMYERVVG